jgi:transposase
MKGNTIMANVDGLIGGIDSHKETIHVAVITHVGHEIGDREFATTQAGYRQAIAWLAGHGRFDRVGVEGTSSYGTGITTALHMAGMRVVEVNRTRPAERRKKGKSDRLDAYRAARSVLSGEATTDPKLASIESLRSVLVARRSAVKAQQAAMRQIAAVLINTPAVLRDRYRDLSNTKLVTALVNSRPTQLAEPDHALTLLALRSLARRHRALTEEIRTLEQLMRAQVAKSNPGLLAVKGVGAVVGAQLLITAGDNPERLRSGPSFAALCGTAPIPVSSGKTNRHRLSRGGDRQANAALHHIVKVRLSCDPRTRIYRDDHIAKGWTSAAAFRALKRAVAREIYRALQGNCAVPDYTDLRPARHAKNLTLTAAATRLGVWPATISQLELGQRRDDTLATNYREWLAAA